MGALVVALLVFLVGLAAPLTPSEGRPGAITLVAFVGVPVALSLAAALLTRSAIGRAIGVAVALLMAGAAVWLYAMVL